MRFGGKADVRGIFARFSHSLRRDSVQPDEGEEEVEAVTNSFLGDEDLRNFQPKGRAGMEVVGTTQDGAVDLSFSWDESSENAAARPKVQERRNRPRMPSAELVFDGEMPEGSQTTVAPPLVRKGGRKAAADDGKRPVEGIVRPDVPRLSIVMLICGTRGDVQPFIALGLKLKEYGHRVRIATHRDYRKFVTDYELEFYPLGGDPKILSDFIVKHRGVFTLDTKDAFENLRQVEDVVFSSWDACTKPDPEGDGRAFTAQAIIANPPSYSHIHCAEKLKIPVHIFFTMPWSPTRNFPHPLARISNVRDSRPSSVAIRNYLSYVIVNEYVYTGLSNLINRFRKEKLHLQPLRMGNSGASLLDTHNVPFAYCWSPSLVSKPADWDEHIDITGYFFLNEGVRGSYQPPSALAEFLAAGPPPVYIGFGSLIVDDHKKVTQKILDAIEITGQRLLLSKGWAGLGEGFDLPDDVLLLDDVPHDWLLPQCSAVVHHGGAGTTAAGLIAACPTTVIPFFGDQAFWGSAVYRRGVGPRPIPIDSLTTKKLVTALEFMQQPEVKVEAIKVSKQIQLEDGVGEGLKAFHKHLPVEDLLARRPVDWELAKPSIAGFFTELGGGIADLFIDPFKGAQKDGVRGAFKGFGKGLESVVTRPIKGFGLAGSSVIDSVQVDNMRCFHPPAISGDTEELKQSNKQSLSKMRHSSRAGSGSRSEGIPEEQEDVESAAQDLETEEGRSLPDEQQQIRPPYLRTYSFRMATPEEEDGGEEEEATSQQVEHPHEAK